MRAGAEVMLVAAAYAGLAVWWLWPLPRLLATHSGRFSWSPLPGAADFYLIVWALAWGAHALVTAPWQIFHANSFYPSTLSLAYSEHFLGYLPIFALVCWGTGNAIVSINAVILTSYVFTSRSSGTCCGAPMLCWWTGSWASPRCGPRSGSPSWRSSASHFWWAGGHGARALELRIFASPPAPRRTCR